MLSAKENLHKLLNQAGQTLLEILLAFGVSILILSAVILGVVTSLSNAQYAKNQGLANSYAQEGMSVVRQMRDSSWPDFNRKTGKYCLPQDAVTLPSDNDNTNCIQTGKVGDFFARSVTLVQGSSNCSGGGMNGNQATVTVSWADSKCSSLCHSVQLITCFSNIDSKLTP